MNELADLFSSYYGFISRYSTIQIKLKFLMNFHTVISTVVKSDLEKAWPHLWRKAYETKEFIPTLKELTIHQKTDDLVLRTMSTGDILIKERIIGDKSTYTVYFHNIEGSQIKGLIYNTLYLNQKGQLILEFGSNAFLENGHPAPPLEIFTGALKHTGEILEKYS